MLIENRRSREELVSSKYFVKTEEPNARNQEPYLVAWKQAQEVYHLLVSKLQLLVMRSWQIYYLASTVPPAHQSFLCVCCFTQIQICGSKEIANRSRWLILFLYLNGTKSPWVALL